MGQRVRFLEPDEAQRLMEAPNLRSLTGLRNRCVLGLLYEAGLRIDECLSLKPRDVVLSEKRIEILRGKGGRPRTVYFRTDELAMLIEQWKKVRPRSDFLFCTVRSSKGKGTKLSARSFRFSFKRYAEQAGLPSWVTPHVLRHTFATLLLRSGANLRVVQIALGHSSVATTQIYTHVTSLEVKQAIQGAGSPQVVSPVTTKDLPF